MDTRTGDCLVLSVVRVDRRPRSPGLYGCRNVHVRDDDCLDDNILPLVFSAIRAWPLEERILSAQATILATSFGALVLAALFSERRTHELAILERERRLEEALRAGGVITFDWDVRVGLIRLSQNAAEILGLGPRQSLSSVEWVRQIHPDDRPSVTTRLNIARPDEHSHSMTFRFLRPDGRGEVWLEQVAVTHFDASGMPTRINGLTTDVTERKRFEEEISRAWKSAALADQAKTSFLSAASHDLRQPLQTLRFLHAALEPHLRMGRDASLSAEWRDLSTPCPAFCRACSMSIAWRPGISVRRRATSRSMKYLIPWQPISLDSVADKGLRWRLVRSQLVVRSDKGMLEAMLRNLLSNAVRYTDRGDNPAGLPTRGRQNSDRGLG